MCPSAPVPGLLECIRQASPPPRSGKHFMGTKPRKKQIICCICRFDVNGNFIGLDMFRNGCVIIPVLQIYLLLLLFSQKSETQC